MSRNAKLIIAIAGLLFICCVCGSAAAFFAFRSLGRAFITDAGELDTMAANVAAYDLPSGYDELFGMRFLGFEIVAIGPTGPAGQTLIMLMQIPADANLNQEEMETQMQEALQQQQSFQDLQLEVVGETTATIRDQTVMLTIREGSDADGRMFRQVSGVFQGNRGPTLVMIQAPLAEWDQALVDEFLASLR